MNLKIDWNKSAEPLRVLLVGNNPIDLSRTLEKIQHVKGRRIITETAFDLKSVCERLMNFNPGYILIDDNIGRLELASTMEMLRNRRKTRNIPITVLKNSNYHEAAPSAGILDYLLKQNFSADALYNAICNSLKFKRTQELLSTVYRKRRGIGKFAL